MHVGTTRAHRHAIHTEASEHSRGAMTAVMRSVSAPPLGGPRILRVGLVHAGHVIEDRLVKDRRAVTVGTSERVTFTAPALGATFVTLFARVGDGYELCVTPGMTGRVADGESVVDLAELGRGVVPGREAARIRLSDEARGRVTLGETTFLFQFVVPPLPAARPELPLAVKSGLAGHIDWSLTIVAAFSFLLHFGVVGAMYSDWMDPIVDTDATVTGVLERMKDFPEAPPEIAPLPVDVAPSTSGAVAVRAPAPAPARPNPRPAATAATPHKLTPTEQAALAAAADALGLVTLAVLAPTGPAVAGALRESDVPSVDLGDPARSAAGAEASGGNNLHLGHGVGPVTPGTSTSLGNLGRASRDPGDRSAGVDTPRSGPVVVNVEPIPGPTETALPGATAVVAGLRPGFRSCYNAGLRVEPNMAGRVMLNARVASNGEVADASASSNAGLSEGVVQCLLKRLRTAQFEPGHPGASVSVPVNLLHP
jgi:hypothetical protein